MAAERGGQLGWPNVHFLSLCNTILLLPSPFDRDLLWRNDNLDGIAVGGTATAAATHSQDHGFYFSADGQRQQEELHQIAHKRRRLEPTAFETTVVEFRLVPEDLPGDAEELDSATNPLNAVDEGRSRKRKSYASSEWNGNFWVDTSLAKLGLVYQLGHAGFPCIFPNVKVYRMTIIEAPIIHQIHIRYCKCSKSDPAAEKHVTLDVFRLYNVVGNMNVNDFIHAMERATDATASTGMTWLPDRYKQFQQMGRQWAFILRAKRAALANLVDGLMNPKLGSMAVVCWMCPFDGCNLPPGWRDADPDMRFLYMLLLAVDANFKLKNRMRPNEIDGPSLGPRWSYWVEPKRYRCHLKKYIAEKDLSTCIAFAALLQKDTQLTTGLRASGVGGYSNMDYIIMSALVGFNLMLLTISYDITCQWKKNLAERNEKLPKRVRLPLKDFTYQCALPVWHAASHNEKCQTANSLSFKSNDRSGPRCPSSSRCTRDIKKVMSWIWTAPGALDDEEECLHDSIRVEWTRTRARKIRWSEEVATLQEEMHRVLRYLKWQSDWWNEHIGKRSDVSDTLASGLHAYTLKQADFHNRLRCFFERKWTMPAVQAARHLVSFEERLQEEVTGLEDFFTLPTPPVTP
ncbi:hypothetical protein C8R43DRAFT_1143385 [Mycena crocata]|nr:hypothetical protein C8R43DRAFT_1143385 [Mycena crocata]